MEGNHGISPFWKRVDWIEGHLRRILSYAWPFAKGLSGSQRLLRAVILLVVVYCPSSLLFLLWLGPTEPPPELTEELPAGN